MLHTQTHTLVHTHICTHTNTDTHTKNGEHGLKGETDAREVRLTRARNDLVNAVEYRRNSRPWIGVSEREREKEQSHGESRFFCYCLTAVVRADSI